MGGAPAPARLGDERIALAVVRGLASLATSALPATDVFDLAAGRIRESLGLRAVLVYEADRDQRVLQAAGTAGLTPAVAMRIRLLPIERLGALQPLITGEAAMLQSRENLLRLPERLSRDLQLHAAQWLALPIHSDGEVVGLAAFSADRAEPFSSGDVEILETVTETLGAVLTGTRRAAEQADRCARAEAEMWASRAILATAEAMNEHADLEGVLAALATSVSSFLSGGPVRVGLVDGETNELVVMAGAGTEGDPRTRLPLEGLDPVELQALQERRSAVSEGAEGPCGPADLPTFVVIPIVGHDRLIGVIEACDTNSPERRRERLRVLEDVALEATAAIESAEAFERQRRAAELRESLNQVNALLSQSLDRPLVLDEVLTEGCIALHATAGLFARRDNRGWSVERQVGGEPEEQARRMLAPNEAEWVEAALENRGPVVRFDDVPVLIVPLRLADRTFGALLFREQQIRNLDAETLDFATKLGATVSMALANQYLYEHEREIAETLQQALLSIPDRVPGVELAHHYVAATERTRVGGDFYDAFEVGDGTIVLVVGDVSGKGLEAAALTALVKNTIKAHAVEGLSPARTMEKTNDTIFRFSTPEVFVTVFVASIDTRRRTAQFCSAGHPPAMLVARGHVVPLALAGPLLGAFQGVGYQQGSVELAEGDTLVLYTDGLTETRRGDELYGEERLIRLLRRIASYPTAEIPAAIVASLKRFGETRDDLALLIARLTS